MMSEDSFSSNAEWSVGEWSEEWSITVGKAFACSECGTMIMVTKGGIGVLETKCCGKEMRTVEGEGAE